MSVLGIIGNTSTTDTVNMSFIICKGPLMIKGEFLAKETQICESRGSCQTILLQVVPACPVIGVQVAKMVLTLALMTRHLRKCREGGKSCFCLWFHTCCVIVVRRVW